jgi:hypothetical protein
MRLFVNEPHALCPALMICVIVCLSLHKDELRKLAAIGALNFIQDPFPERALVKVNRRDALWQVERVVRAAGSCMKNYPNETGIPLCCQ